MKKLKKWLQFAGVGGFCIIFYAITMFPQDLMLLEYKKAFGEIKHPPGTKSIKTFTSFGTLDKTRVMYKDIFPQGCDYRVGEIREYSGDKGNVEAFYAAQTRSTGARKTSAGVMFIPIKPDGIIDPYALTKEESIKMGPEGYQILDRLRDDQYFRFLELNPSASYYFIGMGGFSVTDLDIRCQF